MDAAERRAAYHVEHDHEASGATRTAVTFARDRNLEREAVVDERAILRDALQRSLGEARVEDMKQEVERRVVSGDFIAVEQEPSTAGRSFTTPAMMELERETIDRMRAGQGQHAELGTDSTRDVIAREYDHLNEGQRTAVHQILAMPELDGIEATRQIRKVPALSQIPVFAISAYVTAEVRADAIAAGCTEVFRKPIDVEALLDRIGEFLLPGSAPLSVQLPIN